MAIDLRRRRFAAGLVVLGAGGALGLRAIAQPAPEVVHIVAKRFVWTPSEVHLKKGVATVLELTSADVPMGFSAPDFKVRADVLPGTISRLTITPEKAGNFGFVCDVFCGSGHEDMQGTIVVTS
jgi:cytochrome c oxidase subunit 2